MEGGSPSSGQRGRLIDKDGGTIPIRVGYTPLRNEKGDIIGGLATFHDMTLVERLNQAIRKRYTFHDMIGKSAAMQKIFDIIPVVADSDATVLIEGPTGTGKDLLAKYVHLTSHRAEGTGTVTASRVSARAGASVGRGFWIRRSNSQVSVNVPCRCISAVYGPSEST